MFQFTPQNWESIKKDEKTIKKDEKDEIMQGDFHEQKEKKVDQSLLTMESFTIDFVSNELPQLFKDNTLSSFTTLLP